MVPMRVLFALWFSAPLVAQTTWVVPSFSSLDSYIAQAAPGDTLLLGAWHPGFHLNKGLTLLPAAGRTRVYPDFSPGLNRAWLEIPAGQAAHLLNIDFWSPGWGAPQGLESLSVTVDGVASFADCSFAAESVYWQHASLTVASGATSLDRCTVTAGQSSVPLNITGGVCSVVASTITGAQGFTTPYGPGGGTLAARVAGVLIASSSTFTPGTAYADSLNQAGPSPGLWVLPGGRAWLENCNVSAADWPIFPAFPPPWPAVSAIHADGSVLYAACTLSPGLDPFGQAAPPTAGNAAIDVDLVGCHDSGHLLLGTAWTVTATAGVSGQPLGLAFWSELAPITLPFVPEPVWGDPAQALLVNFTLPAPGAAVPISVTIPNTGTLVGVGLWAQALQLNLPLVRASALVGGIVH